jgi:hypothetical protein
VNRQQLVERLTSEFGAERGSAQTVARQAGDLADSGRLAGDAGYDLTDGIVLDNLGDAPRGYTLVKRWNWWVGALELAYGNAYRRFRVRPGID